MAKILVIEDDPTFLDLLRVHLSTAGHQVQTAEDAEIGLRSLISQPPDLVVLDMNVPYLDGFELLEAVRKDPATRGIPVIVITGRADDESYARARRIGVADYFTKPVQRDQLITSVEKHLREPGAPS